MQAQRPNAVFASPSSSILSQNQRQYPLPDRLTVDQCLMPHFISAAAHTLPTASNLTGTPIHNNHQIMQVCSAGDRQIHHHPGRSIPEFQQFLAGDAETNWRTHAAIHAALFASRNNFNALVEIAHIQKPTAFIACTGAQIAYAG